MSYTKATFDSLSHNLSPSINSIIGYENSNISLILMQLLKSVSDTSDSSITMQIIVDSACKITGAYSSCLIILDKCTDSFVVGSHTQTCKGLLTEYPRREGGLTHHIISSGGSIIIHDTTEDDRVRPLVIREGIRSIIGSCVKIEDKIIGVLYINGLSKHQFQARDATTMEMMSLIASIALNRARVLLEPSISVDEALSNFQCQEGIFETICCAIKQRLNFDLVSIQMVNYEKDILETVYGVGIAKEWVGLANYRLDESPEFRNVHVEIFSTGYIEIIEGWDARFDQWLYESFEHKQHSHAYIPIIMFRSKNGGILEDWSDHCEWKIVSQKKSDQGLRTVISIVLSQDYAELCEPVIDIIGTLEVGRISHYQQESLSLEEIIELSRFIGQQTRRIHSSQLSHVLQAIVERAGRIVGADAASLYFLYKPNLEHYAYRVSAGSLPIDFLRAHPPRTNGLGAEAIKNKAAVFMPDYRKTIGSENFKERNLDLYNKGMRSKAVFPLLDGDKYGMLYLYFRREHRFIPDEIRWIDHYSRQIINVIHRSIDLEDMKRKYRQLSTLGRINLSLAEIDKETDQKKLLKYISGAALHILIADSVIIYEYRDNDNYSVDKRFLISPAISGNLVDIDYVTDEPVHKNSTPYILIEGGKSVYNMETPSINHPPRLSIGRVSTEFVKREGIRSSAGVILRNKKEIFGVMFVNYKRAHRFSEEEIRVCENIASAASLSISNIRILQEERRQAWVTICSETAHRIGTEMHVIDSAIGKLEHDAKKRIFIRRQKILKYVRRIEESLRKTKNFIRSFSEISSVQSYKDDIININSIISDVVKFLDLENTYNIKVVTKLDDFVPNIVADKEKFVYVFQEMIKNSMHFMGPGGTLLITTRIAINIRNQKKIIIDIWDDGIGIEENRKDKIFEPGFKSRLEGSGLGLSIVKKTIEKYFGSIKEVGVYNNGAHFVISIPVPTNPLDR